MVSRAELDAIAADVSNWGRWGPEDERGTLNLIDDDALRRGLDAVVDRTSFSLAMPLDLTIPRLVGQPSRQPPLRSALMVNFAFSGDDAYGAFNDDAVAMGVQASTHWDALSHCTYDGQLYNGFPAGSVSAAGGAARCGIDKVGPIVTRGVLLDVAAHLGVDAVPHGEPITTTHLDATAAAAGVDVAPGDVVLIRTGAASRLRAGDRRFYEHGSCGLAPEVARWFRRHDVAAYAIDGQNPETFPPDGSEVFLPMHLLCLRDLGMVQGQNWVLDDLAAACASDGRHPFLLSATPDPFTGASGAPVTPVALR